MRYSKADARESLTVLRRLLRPGRTVYCVLRHVSRSGMMRHISFFILRRGERVDISFHVSRALGYSRPRTASWVALRVEGAGMDMGFAVVYDMAHVVFAKRATSGSDRGYMLKSEWV